MSVRKYSEYDSKSYFGFVVDKSSEPVHTEIATFSQLLRNQTASHSLNTGNLNTLSAIKINVLLSTCDIMSFLSRLEGI